MDMQLNLLKINMDQDLFNKNYEATEEEKETIFNEIWEISYELMTDVFGNYVIQKYFEYGTTTQNKFYLKV